MVPGGSLWFFKGSRLVFHGSYGFSQFQVDFFLLICVGFFLVPSGFFMFFYGSRLISHDSMFSGFLKVPGWFFHESGFVFMVIHRLGSVLHD